MSYLLNDAATFVDDMTKGFVAAHGAVVRRAPGGVVRAADPVLGHVAVVIGGGSGHYPAFAGLVGPGLAHGAAMGNVFASPSAQRVYDVARTVESGGGVLLTYGNYAGDVLNFDQAQRRLESDGVACRTVLVTDDISSAPPGDESSRRGIAGDLIVFKVAAAAADAGARLDEVVRIAEHANARTRTLGVAFSGCTLPGAEGPLFTVPTGRMGVGMGIHGEPGIDEAPRPDSRGLARLLVDRLLHERPEDSPGRAIVLVNGLGSVKGEELYLLFGDVADCLRRQHVQIIQPEVGELVTSFEMAGVSLTLCWTDDELERLWAAPAETPAYRKGTIETSSATVTAPPGRQLSSASPDRGVETAAGSDQSQAAAAVIVRGLAAIRSTLETHADALGRLDAVAGDGDHGIGMLQGASAALDAATAAHQRHGGARTVLTSAATAWSDRAGGTSGALWGVALAAVGDVLGDQGSITADDVARAVVAACEAVMAAGHAAVGDKTMVDALVPFSATLAEKVSGGAIIGAAWRHAARMANDAAQTTAALLPRRGRARPHAQASQGSPDPGAVSFALVVDAMGSVLGTEAGDSGGQQ